MATLSAPALVDIYQAIEHSPQYPSMRRGGIVGDVRHQRRGGYHISRADQSSSSNYSIQAPADKRGPANLASGIDLTMNPADMRQMTGRLMAACKRNHANPAAEPRIECIREFFGTLNGSTVTGWNRYPSSNRGVGLTSSDSSHLWHVHISIFRDYADDPAKTKGLTDILLGVPLKPTPPAPLPEGDEVAGLDDPLDEHGHDYGWYAVNTYRLAKAANARTVSIAADVEGQDVELDDLRRQIAELTVTLLALQQTAADADRGERDGDELAEPLVRP